MSEQMNGSCNRRDFLRLSAAAGLGGLAIAGCSQTRGLGAGFSPAPVAKPLDVVRIGYVGVGGMGMSHVGNLLKIEGVEIRAVCDIVEEKVARAQKVVQEAGQPKPDGYCCGPQGYLKLCAREDLDLVYTATPWEFHTPVCVAAMKAGKHAATEVPAAITTEECWQLVETSEQTGKYAIMMENCCYGRIELMVLNMVRKGLFGELLHGECGYLHDLRGIKFSSGGEGLWRLEHSRRRDANLYPTHGLGPICQIMDINRGDRMNFLVSVMSRDFQMNNTALSLAETDPFYKKYVDRKYRGNMTTTTVLTEKGRTIMIQHDVTSPNVYSRIHKVSGTKAAALKYPLPAKISIGDEWVKDEEMKTLEEKFTPPIVRKVGELAKQVGGHGGMDFLENWRLIDCLRNGLPLDQDVYDAALWSAIAPLSEWSVESRSYPVPVPDFTRGAWKTNLPVDIAMEKGGNTRVIR